MSQFSRLRPSPAMVVACVALSFALAGSAVGGTAAISSKLDRKERKQVKRLAQKQANKRITKRAPGLSVASAVNATNAVNATAAESANVANTANALAGEYYAAVNADGTIARATPNVSARRLTQGQYLVYIDRNTSQCFYTGSIGGTGTVSSGTIALLRDPGFQNGENAVYVITRDTGDVTADRAFTVHIRC